MISFRVTENKDGVFYYLVGLVLYIALMRLFFYKYVTTMFTLFFRATLRQQQLREQLLQAPLPALLMNIFFVVSFATYCTLLALHFKLPFAQNFWTTLFYAVILIAVIYFIKFIFLNIVGWIFGISNVTDTYIFIVFLIKQNDRHFPAACNCFAGISLSNAASGFVNGFLYFGRRNALLPFYYFLQTSQK